MHPPTAAVECLALSVRLACVGILIRSLEIAVNRRLLEDGELLGWGGVATSSHAIGRFLQRLQGYPVCLLVPLGRAAIAAASLFLPYNSWGMAVALGFLVLAQLYHNHRFAALVAASDHLLLACLAAQFFGALPGVSAGFQAACLGFIAFQALLAYVAAAKHKLANAHWRTGARLAEIFRESAFRFPPLGRFFGRHPRLARSATWAAILFQLSFPLCVVLPPEGFWLMIAASLLFHGVIAFTMGLHGFLWAFAATYPALYFSHTWANAALARG